MNLPEYNKAMELFRRLGEYELSNYQDVETLTLDLNAICSYLETEQAESAYNIVQGMLVFMDTLLRAKYTSDKLAMQIERLDNVLQSIVTEAYRQCELDRIG